jgi:hypothetical protein
MNQICITIIDSDTIDFTLNAEVIQTEHVIISFSNNQLNAAFICTFHDQESPLPVNECLLSLTVVTCESKCTGVLNRVDFFQTGVDFGSKFTKQNVEVSLSKKVLGELGSYV